MAQTLRFVQISKLFSVLKQMTFDNLFLITPQTLNLQVNMVNMRGAKQAAFRITLTQLNKCFVVVQIKIKKTSKNFIYPAVLVFAWDH